MLKNQREVNKKKKLVKPKKEVTQTSKKAKETRSAKGKTRKLLKISFTGLKIPSFGRLRKTEKKRKYFIRKIF
jgi:hypothetical protein